MSQFHFVAGHFVHVQIYNWCCLGRVCFILLLVLVCLASVCFIVFVGAVSQESVSSHCRCCLARVCFILLPVLSGRGLFLFVVGAGCLGKSLVHHVCTGSLPCRLTRGTSKKHPNFILPVLSGRGLFLFLLLALGCWVFWQKSGPSCLHGFAALSVHRGHFQKTPELHLAGAVRQGSVSFCCWCWVFW